MAKGKTRASSQRNGNGSRSKSSSANGSFAGGGGGGGDYDDDNTITDSFTMGSLASAYEEGYNEDFDDTNDMDTLDDLIQHGGDSHREDAALRASSQLQSLYDVLTAMEDTFVQEKRTASREATLRRLFKCITLYATTSAGWEMVSNAANGSDDNSVLVQALCHVTLRVGSNASATEQYAACRVIEAISIVLGAHEEAWVDAIETVLRRIVQSSVRATAVRMAALRAWSLAATICASTDMERACTIQDVCQALGLETTYRTSSSLTPMALRVTALDCWALLATTMDDEDLAGGGGGEDGDNHDSDDLGRGCAILPKLYDCLNLDTIPKGSSSIESMMELRSAAGECLALIHEARLRLGGGALVQSNNNDYLVEEDLVGRDVTASDSVKSGGTTSTTTTNRQANTTTRRFGRGSWEGASSSASSSNLEAIMEDVKQRMSELATESNGRHSMSKRAKKAQRSTFREYLATVVDDEAPCEVLSLRGHFGTLQLSTWNEIVVLNFVRHALQGGFQTQMMSNPTLQALFLGSEGGNGKNNMSQLEKRLVFSKASEAYKLADQDRRGKRDKRENIKNHFLTADGEDL